MKMQKTQKSQNNIEEQSGELTLPNVMSYYKALLLKNKHTDQWNKIEDQEISNESQSPMRYNYIPSTMVKSQKLTI